MALGISTWGYSSAPTALIPAYIGFVLLVCGILALKPGVRKHAMHAAAAIALLAFLATIPGLISLFQWIAGGSPIRPLAIISKSITSLLSLAFVLVCIRSFISARRKRQNS
jgi:hypothetical protein